MSDILAVVFAAVALGGGIWAHVEAWRAQDAGTWRTLLFLDVVVLFLAGTALASPPRFQAWMQEDAWVEWCTFYAFVLAALLRLDAVLRARAGKAEGFTAVTALAWGTVALFCVAVAGEEISWGQRLLAFKPPSVFLEANFQQELNVHNLLKGKAVGGFKLDSRYLVALIAGVYGVLLPALLRVRRLREATWTKLFRDAAPRPLLVPFFALVAAVSLDYPVELAGEAVEWVLGLAFLSDAALTWHAHRTFSPAFAGSAIAATRATSLLLGVLTPVLLEHTVYGTDEERVAQARAELAQLAQDFPEARTAQLGRLGRVHKRLFTATRGGYFHFGEKSRYLEGKPTPAEVTSGGRDDRRGYFLDPWNNPYWIDSRRKRNKAVLYSFGPNRKRDTDLGRYFKGKTGFRGDDLGVEVPLDALPAAPLLPSPAPEAAAVPASTSPSEPVEDSGSAEEAVPEDGAEESAPK